mmetsp:Transcript_46217/g.91111  ORF Transcript_46217/g.91111 Transcript_46217/m.91111 type:complete len:94 (-) Transcript_46217:3243-3524(-)
MFLPAFVCFSLFASSLIHYPARRILSNLVVDALHGHASERDLLAMFLHAACRFLLFASGTRKALQVEAALSFFWPERKEKNQAREVEAFYQQV